MKNEYSGKSLFCRYPGRRRHQSTHIYVDLDRRAFGASYNPYDDSTVSERVFDGREVWTKIALLKQAPLAALLEKIAPLAERMADGYDRRWTGSRHVVSLSEDAKNAREEIEEACYAASQREQDIVSVYDASDWFAMDDRELSKILGIGVFTPDETIEEIAREQELALPESEAILFDGEHALYALRERLRESSHLRFFSLSISLDSPGWLHTAACADEEQSDEEARHLRDILGVTIEQSVFFGKFVRGSLVLFEEPTVYEFPASQRSESA